MNEYYEVTTPPSENPVTLKDTKCFCKIEHDDEDVLVDSLIKAANRRGERITNRLFMQRTITGYFPGLAVSRYEPYPYVQINRAPVISITSVQTMLGGVLVDVDSDTYDYSPSNGFPRIFFTSVPDCDDIPTPLQIVFVGGYAKPSDLPEEIAIALQMDVNFLYSNRGDVMADGKLHMPLEARDLYYGNRILNTF